MNTIKAKLKQKVKKNRKLYVLAKCIKNWYDKDFYKLVSGYYEENNSCSSFVIEHLGDMYPDNIIYNILVDVPQNSNNIQRSHVGFFAQIRLILQALDAADHLNALPSVYFGENASYYDSEMDNITKNVFEYYFEPVSTVNYLDIDSCRNVIRMRDGQTRFFMKYGSCDASYLVDQDEINKLAAIYKKYIRLNSVTDQYVTSNISKCLSDKKTLGVHIRGTDYKLEIKAHPNIISVDEYINLAKELCSKNNYKQIFLATDDLEILSIFQNEFGDKLVYYNDAFRTAGNVGPHNTYDNRPLHYYRLGLEVIRDVYTLAWCDSFICGLSQVSFAVRYINIALDRTFDELVILNRGINPDNSKIAAKMYKDLAKEQKDFKHDLHQNP